MEPFRTRTDQYSEGNPFRTRTVFMIFPNKTKDLNSNNANLPSSYDMSVADYYNEISIDQLNIVGDAESVIDWITAAHEYSYYVDGAQGTGQGSNGISNSAAALVVEIAMQVDSDINFKKYIHFRSIVYPRRIVRYIHTKYY